MYRVINKTQKEIRCGREILSSNEETIIFNNTFDTNIIRNKEGILVCQIISEYGEHSSECYEKMICIPKKGKDGTIFVISEK